MPGIPCIVGNALSNHGSEWQNSQQSWILQSSVGNNGSSAPIYPLWQCILHAIFMFLMLILYHIAKRKFINKDKELDVLLIVKNLIPYMFMV